MAGNLKQRLIKAGRDFNYAEGVKVLNNTGSTIVANKIVYASGNSGPFITIALAKADAEATCAGRLHIVKHDIPAGGYGVCLPWKLATGLTATDATLPAAAAGAELYLSQGTAGVATASKPGSGIVRAVGSVVTAETASNADGAVLFSNDCSVVG
tara:strand:- start:1900 stop:2364 length:465 start_codon:yes stop_codon:yes gene_type:complete